MNDLVSVLVPAYNEEDKIVSTLKAVQSLEYAKEIIVIDDGSVDETYRLANQLATRVIRLNKNRGKGAALNLGYKQARGDIILLLDADLAQTAIEANKLLEPLFAQKAEMVIAQFPRAEVKGGFGITTGLASWGLKRLVAREFNSPLSGQRALFKKVIDEIGGFADGFGVEVALTIDVCSAGFKVIEIPVKMKHRETERDLKGFLHRGSQFKDIAKILINKVKRSNE